MPLCLSPYAAKNAVLVKSRIIRMAENVAGLALPVERRNTSTMKRPASPATEDGGQMLINRVKRSKSVHLNPFFQFYTSGCDRIPIENIEMDSPESIFVMVLASLGEFPVQTE